MKRIVGIILILIPALTILPWSKAQTDEKAYDGRPPFGLTLLETVTVGDETVYQPKNPYNITINYELGMHCVGFDLSYCCIIPPYNSIQSQAVQSGLQGEKPRLLSPENEVTLHYAIRDNSYSEGNKMRYWQVPKDVSGKGTMSEPNDNFPNYLWSHLFIYQDLNGTLPRNPDAAKRRYIGKQIPVDIDSGPTGKPLSGGFMDYAAGNGGNIVFTDSMDGRLKNIPLRLTSSYLWDALGLPLTAFNDSTRKGSIRTINDLDFQPYQYATVQVMNKQGQPVMVKEGKVEFFGAEPIDIANCQICHAGQGIAASLSRGGGLTLFDKEYLYWKTRYPDASDYYARIASASILVLELHDKRHKTAFLKEYDPGAASNRLGRVGPVNCADCHGDNMSGNLQVPRPGATGYTALGSKSLSEAIHARPCQICPHARCRGKNPELPGVPSQPLAGPGDE